MSASTPAPDAPPSPSGGETPPEGGASQSAEPAQPKPSETVDFWKTKAREQEKRAKENAEAAQRLKEIEDAQKTEAQKSADRIADLEAQIPAQLGAAFRDAAVAFGGISREDADLFLTGTDQETLIKQAERLGARVEERKKKGPVVPGEGRTPNTPQADEKRELVRNLFGRTD